MSDDEGSKGLREIIVKFLGPAASELGELAADHIRYYRWRSAISIVEKARKWANERGIKTDEVPVRFMLPFLERCSLEAEDTAMADRWSTLLVNAVTHYESKFEVYSHILSNITADEAKLLRCMWCKSTEYDVYHYDEYHKSFSRIPDSIDFGEISPKEKDEKSFEKAGRIVFLFQGQDIPNTNEFVLSRFEEGQMLLHLESMNLVRNNTETFLLNKERSFVFYSDITPLGFDLVSTCERINQ